MYAGNIFGVRTDGERKALCAVAGEVTLAEIIKDCKSGGKD